MSLRGFIDDLVIHIDIVFKVGKFILLIDCKVEDMYRDRL